MNDLAPLAVVIPTRSRPEKLRACLAALAEARAFIDFPVYVCDSSPDPEVAAEVRRVSESFAFTTLHRHAGKNISASKNFCVTVAREPLLVNVDDDVNVEPEAISKLYERYRAASGWRVVGGSVFWGETWDGPIVVRPTGYGRRPRAGEAPSFLGGAFFLYPKALAEHYPWNEHIAIANDKYMGALWRAHGVALLHEPAARALHNAVYHTYPDTHHASHVYTNLFEVLLAHRNLRRAALAEAAMFAAVVRRFVRYPKTALTFGWAWVRGHVLFVRDWGYLKGLLEKPLPDVRKTRLE